MTPAKFFELLRISADTDESRRERRLRARIAGSGFYDTCSRCCGSGHYSYCPDYGTTCFKCSGSGKQSRAYSQKLLAELEAFVASGAYDTYLAELRARSIVERAAKSAQARVMAAWETSGVSKAYDWRKASQDGPDREISERFNNPMYEAHKCVSEISTRLESAQWKLSYSRTLTAEERPSVQAEIETLMPQLAACADAALAEIHALTTELQAFVEAQAVAV